MSADAMRCSNGSSAFIIGSRFFSLTNAFTLGKSRMASSSRHLDARRRDAILNRLQRRRVHGLGNDFVGALKRIDGINQVYAQVIYIDEAPGHADKFLVALDFNFAVSHHGIHHHMLTDLLPFVVR